MPTPEENGSNGANQEESDIRKRSREVNRFIKNGTANLSRTGLETEIR